MAATRSFDETYYKQRKKSKEYRNYKVFQSLNQNILDLADDPVNLDRLSIEELLRSYAIVEKIYLL